MRRLLLLVLPLVVSAVSVSGCTLVTAADNQTAASAETDIHEQLEAMNDPYYPMGQIGF